MTVVLESERLTLRPVRSADATTLWNVWNDRDVYRYLGARAFQDLPTLERVQTGARRIEEHWALRGWGPFVVTRRDDGAVIGETGLYPVPDGHGGSTAEIELGHRYGKPFWGQGYGREAAGLVMDWARSVVGIDALVSIVNAENVASRRIAESLGFRLVDSRVETFEQHTYTDCWYRWQQVPAAQRC